MTTRDVRVGNLVIHPIFNDETTIRAIAFNGFYIGTKDGVPLHTSEFQPIPLTEEWLRRLGFIQQGKRAMWVKDKICITFTEYPDLHGKSTGPKYYLGLKDLGNVIFRSVMSVEHVHQLQNIYYFITNTELDYE